VFIIDDNTDDREIIQKAVADIDSRAKCYGYSNSLTALRRLYEVTPKPSIIFVDLRMPLIGHRNWLQLFQSDPLLKSIPVIGCGGNLPGSDLNGNPRGHAYELIPKPLPAIILKETLMDLWRTN